MSGYPISENKLLNVDTGEITTAKGLSDISAIIPYKDGRLLIEQYSYDDDSCARFVSYDPRDNSYEELSRVSVENGSAFTGMAYNSTSDTLYCIPKELEAQPSIFSSHLLLPRRTALPFVEEEIRKLGGHASPRQMEVITSCYLEKCMIQRKLFESQIGVKCKKAPCHSVFSRRIIGLCKK